MNWAAIKKCEICGKRIGLWADFRYNYQSEKTEKAPTIEYQWGRFKTRVYPKDNEKLYVHNKCIIIHGHLVNRQREIDDMAKKMLGGMYGWTDRK